MTAPSHGPHEPWGENAERQTLTFKKMFAIHWDQAVGKLLFGRGADKEPVLLGKVKRTQYTNFGGPLRTIVTFEDGQKEFPLGPESPHFAVRYP